MVLPLRLDAPSPPTYQRRKPEDSALYRILQEHLETFLARLEAEGRCLPGFVEAELRAFLDCGVLSHGFARFHCDACGKDLVVGFS